MRKLSAFLLSLFTIVGGHILNQRTDKALLFFSLLLVVSILNVFLHPIISLATGPHVASELYYNQRFLPFAVFFTLGLVALISAITSYLDARKPSLDKATTPSAILGGILSVLIALIVVGYMSLYVSLNLQLSKKYSGAETQDKSSRQTNTIPEDSWVSSFSGPNTHFWHNLKYSYEWVPDEQLTPLPTGEAYLSGRIIYAGKPASGVTLTGVFNNQFISDEITTDSEGRYSFRVPPGEWRLNRINTKRWTDKPPGKAFTLIGSASSRLSDDLYHDSPNHVSGDFTVTTKPQPHVDAKLELIIRDNITIAWPNKASMPADLESDTITWLPVVDAANYQVQLQHIERQGTTTTYSPVYWVNSDTTALPLEKIRTMKSNDVAVNEYQVVVHAFDEEGRLLASSPTHFPLRSLTIQDRQIPSMQLFPSLKSDQVAMTEDEIEQMQKEKKMIDAATVLAEADMPSTARELVAKLSSKHLEKRLDTLEGVILIAEGQCEAARLHFESTNHKWERNCTPDFYKKRCSTPTIRSK
ncbi:MAG: hypothetical protein AB2792_14590 [Candidatus Thiodiazotropha sp.]